VTQKQQKEAQSAPLDRQEEPLTIVFDKKFPFCEQKNFCLQSKGM
jgi:hypothetical protein